MKKNEDTQRDERYKRLKNEVIVAIVSLSLMATGVILLTVGSASPMPMATPDSTALNTNFTVSEQVSQNGYVSLTITANNPLYTHTLITAYVFVKGVEVASANGTNGLIILPGFQTSSSFTLFIYQPNINGEPLFDHAYSAPVSPLQLSSQAIFIFYVVILFTAVILTVKVTQRRERQGNKSTTEYSANTFGDEVRQMDDIDKHLVDDLIPQNASPEEKQVLNKYAFNILYNIGKRISGYYGFSEEVYNNEILGQKQEEINIGTEDRKVLDKDRMNLLKEKLAEDEKLKREGK